MKVQSPENASANANPMQLMEEGGASSFAPPAFNLTASGQTAQLQTPEGEPGEAITDALTYYVSDGNAKIRNNTNPASFATGKIPAGTQVKRLRTFNNGAIAQVELMSGTETGTKKWTSFSNLTAAETVTNSGNRYVFFGDTNLYSGPFGAILTTVSGGQTTNQTVAASNTTAYTIAERCGAYVKLMQGTTVAGWVLEAGLRDQAGRDRGQYMIDLRAWLEARNGEVAALTGQPKKQRILGILSSMENVFHQMQSNTYPAINTLNTSPTYTANAFTSFAPPELTLTMRSFIVALETDDPAEGVALLPGEDIDWNARLGVPQYRTQSDNLTPPEVTCGPTSFTMGAERLGYSRDNMIAAIDAKLRESMPADATQEQVEEKFEEKAKEFLESFASESNSWQKLRGGNEGVAGNEGDLSEGFREWGQYEDLSYFLGWLKGFERGTVASPDSAAMLGALHTAQTGNTTGGPQSDIINFGQNDKLTMDHRIRIQNTLAAGGAVILSLYHKGTDSSGTHITTVREVRPEGLAMDDPYGQINPGYRRGVAGDAFKDVGGTSGRGSYNWRNVPDYSSTATDYADRDFTEDAAQGLQANESRGQNEVLTWAQINDGPRQLINYLRFYSRP